MYLWYVIIERESGQRITYRQRAENIELAISDTKYEHRDRAKEMCMVIEAGLV